MIVQVSFLLSVSVMCVARMFDVFVVCFVDDNSKEVQIETQQIYQDKSWTAKDNAAGQNQDRKGPQVYISGQRFKLDFSEYNNLSGFRE